MHLAADEVARLEAAVEIEIETEADPSSPTHRTIVWVVTDGPDVFLRSVRGATGRWYREATANPQVGVIVDGHRIPARVVPANDADSIARTTAALQRKYAGDPDLYTMLVPGVLDTTLRLEPA